MWKGEAEEGGEEEEGAVYVGVLCSLFFFFLHSAFCPAKEAAVSSAASQ